MSGDATVILAVCAVVGAIYLMVENDDGSIGVIGVPGVPAAAPVQQSPSVSRNFASVVGQAKALLESNGEDLSGPCGAFKITRLAAQMIGGDCGILSKPGGNNCDGYAVDIHVFRDGSHYDVLGDGGGANSPQYNLIGPIDDPGRWRTP